MPTTKSGSSAIDLGPNCVWKTHLGYRPESPQALTPEQFIAVQKQYQFALADSKANPDNLHSHYQVARCLLVLLFDLEKQKLNFYDFTKKILAFFEEIASLDLSRIELRGYYASILGMVSRWLGRNIGIDLHQVLFLTDKILTLYPYLLAQKDIPTCLFNFNDKFAYGDLDLDAFKLFCEDITSLGNALERHANDNKDFLKIDDYHLTTEKYRKIRLIAIASNNAIKRLSEITIHNLRTNYPPLMEKMAALTNIQVPRIKGYEAIIHFPNELEKLAKLSPGDFEMQWSIFISTYIDFKGLHFIQPEQAKKIFLKLYALLIKNMPENKAAFFSLFILSLSLDIEHADLESILYDFHDRTVKPRSVKNLLSLLQFITRIKSTATQIPIMSIMSNSIAFLKHNLLEKYLPQIVLQLSHEEAYILYSVMPPLFKLCSEKIASLNPKNEAVHIQEIKEDLKEIVSYLEGEIRVDFGLLTDETPEHRIVSMRDFCTSKKSEVRNYYKTIAPELSKAIPLEKQQKKDTVSILQIEDIRPPAGIATLTRRQKIKQPVHKPVLSQQEVDAQRQQTDTWLKQLENDKEKKIKAQKKAAAQRNVAIKTTAQPSNHKENNVLNTTSNSATSEPRNLHQQATSAPSTKPTPPPAATASSGKKKKTKAKRKKEAAQRNTALGTSAQPVNSKENITPTVTRDNPIPEPIQPKEENSSDSTKDIVVLKPNIQEEKPESDNSAKTMPEPQPLTETEVQLPQNPHNKKTDIHKTTPYNFFPRLDPQLIPTPAPNSSLQDKNPLAGTPEDSTPEPIQFNEEDSSGFAKEAGTLNPKPQTVEPEDIVSKDNDPKAMSDCQALTKDQMSLIQYRHNELNYIHQNSPYDFIFEKPFLIYQQSFSEIFFRLESTLKEDIAMAEENGHSDTTLVRICHAFFLIPPSLENIKKQTTFLCPYKLYLFLSLKYEIAEKLFRETFNESIGENKEKIADYLHKHSEIFHEINHRILRNVETDRQWPVEQIDIFVDIQNRLNLKFPNLLERLVESPKFIRKYPIKTLMLNSDDHVQIVLAPVIVSVPVLVHVPVLLHQQHNPYLFYNHNTKPEPFVQERPRLDATHK